MYLRSTTLNTNNTMLNYIFAQENQYNKLSEESASGVKVAKPSDDPSAARSILNINTQMNQLQSYLKNMSSSSQELNTLDSTLDSVGSLVQKSSDLAIQAANGTYSNKDLDGFKTQIDSIIESVISAANTQFNGTYIFSGTSTSTPTYTTTKDASGNITQITYQGTPAAGDYQRKVTISDGISSTINTTGDSVFGSYDSTTTPVTSTGVLGSLMTLSTALGAHDQTAVSASLAGLNAASDTINSTQTKFATVANKFTMTTSSINSTILDLKDYKSSLQDVDTAEVLTQLTSAKTALQATYSVTSSMLNGKTLLDYM